MGKIADIKAQLSDVDPGQSVLVTGANGGTLRNILHRMYGKGRYSVREAVGGHMVTIFRPVDPVPTRSMADVWAEQQARRKAE